MTRGESEAYEDRQRLLHLTYGPAEIARLTLQVSEAIRKDSPNLRDGAFTAIAARDLRRLYELYDATFFDGLLARMLHAEAASLRFRLSPRMSQKAGTTTMFHDRNPPTAPGSPLPTYFEIAVSTLLLFNTFREVGRPVTVGGLVCRDRLEALQRIFEHELLHLAEFLAWGASSCDRWIFRRMSRQIFGHAESRHDLVTPREQAAAAYDVHVGDRVSFEHQGVRRIGRVNRITRRATILVDDPDGPLHSDSKRYATFYVPLALLSKEPGIERLP
jgi:hypothetical protein